MMGPSPSVLRKSVLQAAVFYAAILCQPDASQAQNLAEDRKLFETTCTPCHNYDKGGEPDMYGLTLNLCGVVGRKSASAAGFQYSEDLRKSDIVWDEAVIDEFIAARLPGSEKPHLHRIDGGDTVALLNLISSLQAGVARRHGATINVVCCFEAGRDGFWLQRFLTAQGVDTHVLEPTSILINRRARRAKTDRLDAVGMLRVLAAFLRGDRQSCSMVRVPTSEEEDAKRIHRERENLVQERVRIENRIEALLFTQGIRKRPSLRSWDRDLAVLRTGDGRGLPRHLRAELGRLRRRLVMTLELIREVEAERDQAANTKPQDQACHKIAALSRIRGIGENFAAVLTREVFYRSFDNRRQIASYVG